MSSNNTYTLKIAIDDSKIRDLEKRLTAIMSGSALGGANPVPAQGGNQKGVMDNIMKLGAIATGIAGIVMLVQKLVSMTVDASPMLQQMLKLFNYSVMLILRPIGDFFGFFLRPLVVYFLRTIALPFYRQWRPIMIGLASWLGQQALENLDSNRKGGEAILAGDWDTVVEESEKGTEKLQNDLAWLYTTLETAIRSVDWSPLTDLFSNAFNGVNNWLTSITSSVTNLIPTTDELIANWQNNIAIWLEAFNPAYVLVSEMVTWLSNLELPTWTDVTETFKTIETAVGDLATAIYDAIWAIIDKITFGLINNQEENNNSNTENNFFVDVQTGAQETADGIYEYFSDRIKGWGE